MGDVEFMAVVNKEIEHILNIFDDYLANETSIDIQLTKYGYLLIMPINRGETDFSVYKLETAEAVCNQLLDHMVIDYLYKLGINIDCMPKEYASGFYKYIEKYMKQISEYEFCLENYICKGE